MKALLILSCFVVVCFGQTQKILGADRCTWGPDFWCSHVSHAKQCGTIDSCIKQVWPKKKADATLSPECTFCELAVREARRMIDNKSTTKEIEAFLSKICAVVPSQTVKQECQELVDNYLPEMIKTIESDLPDKVVCMVLGFCKSQEPKNHKILPHKLTRQYFKGNNDTYCTDCKKFFGDIQQIISSNTSEAEIEQLVDEVVCSRLGPVEDVCKQLVKVYLPTFMNELRTKVDPDTICAMIGFCRSKSLQKGMEMRLQFKSLVGKLKVRSDESCSICKEVVQELQQLDRSKSFQTDVESFLKQNLCTKLGEFEKECQLLVDTYGQELFEFIAAELDANDVCVSLGFCTQRPVQLPAGMVPLVSLQPAKKIKKPVKDTTCDVCKIFVQEIDDLLGENRTEEYIVKALDKVCNVISEPLKDECLSFVNQYMPVLLQLLLEEASPVRVCEEVGLCKEKKQKPYVPGIPLLLQGVPLMMKASPGEKDSEVCVLCKMVVTFAKKMLDKNSTEADIRKVLDQLCNLLPEEAWKTECDDLVKQYLTIIIDLIEGELTPEEVCDKLNLCGSKNHLLGEKECTYGPSYWCASMENAKKCGTVEHCKKHAWKP